MFSYHEEVAVSGMVFVAKPVYCVTVDEDSFWSTEEDCSERDRGVDLSLNGNFWQVRRRKVEVVGHGFVHL